MAEGRIERQIAELYGKNPFSLYSINQIATELDRTYPFVNKKVHELAEREVFSFIPVGRSHLCRLNLGSEEAMLLLMRSEIGKRDRLIASRPELAQAVRFLREESGLEPYTIFLHAERLHIVCPGTVLRRATGLEKTLESDTILLSPDAFRRLLVSEDLVRDHVILFGFEHFFWAVKQVWPQVAARYNAIGGDRP
ncbi:hypothetical protein JXB02_00050 [Candidatus Woesearchaeota archaeon]|nr:hypothetical protein [Candidatus Woesearchaeota archaeon]